MNDFWLYVSRQEMVIGKTDRSLRKGVALQTAAFQLEELPAFLKRSVPQGRALNVWLSGGMCQHISFPRPRWLFSAKKLQLIAESMFAKYALQQPVDYQLTLLPDRSDVHVWAVRLKNLKAIDDIARSHCRVKEVAPLPALILNAQIAGKKEGTRALIESDAITIATASLNGTQARLVAVPDGQHTSGLDRALADWKGPVPKMELISVPSIELPDVISGRASPALHGWLRAHEQRVANG